MPVSLVPVFLHGRPERTTDVATPAALVLPATGSHWSVGVVLAVVLLGSAVRGAWLDMGGVATGLLFGGIAIASAGLFALGTVVPHLPVIVCAACAVAIVCMAVASPYVGGPRTAVAGD